MWHKSAQYLTTVPRNQQIFDDNKKKPKHRENTGEKHQNKTKHRRNVALKCTISDDNAKKQKTPKKNKTSTKTSSLDDTHAQ